MSGREGVGVGVGVVERDKSEKKSNLIQIHFPAQSLNFFCHPLHKF